MVLINQFSENLTKNNYDSIIILLNKLGDLYMEKNLEELNISDLISMANEGNADAIDELGVRYSNAVGVEKDEKKAFELFKKASEKNCINAKHNLAICYCDGIGTEQDETLAFNILKELAEKYNHAKSYYYLGDFYFWGGPVEIDYKKSFYYYNEALKINPKYLKAKFAIAYAYYAGKGIEQNFEVAFSMFEELAKTYNYPKAYFYLGELYYIGKYPPQPNFVFSLDDNYTEAFYYFNKSIEYNKNIYASKYYLGEMYMLGRGVEEPNCLRAKMYFEEILNEKYDDSYYKLALINSGDFGFPKNEEKANEYFNKIELDLCIAMIYYILAVKPDEEQTLNELLKLLSSEMPVIKKQISQFPINHPAKIYHNRLLSLKKEEYEDIIERLKNKIIQCKDENKLNTSIMILSSDDEVIDLAKCIVKYKNSQNNHNFEDKVDNNKKTILKFYRDYAIDDEETGQSIEYGKTKNDYIIEKDKVLNIEGINCNTKITVKDISEEYVELEIEDDNIMSMENMFSGKINVIIKRGEKRVYTCPSNYFLIIEII